MKKTLRQLIIQLGVPLRDNWTGKTTLSVSGSNKAQMVDEKFKGDAYNSWKGSEVLFHTDPPGGYVNPKEVLDFNGTSGTFTLDSDWSGATGVPAGVPFTLMRLRGAGVPYEYRLAALQHAIENAPLTEVVEDLGLTLSGQGNLYAIPLGVDTIWEVNIGGTIISPKSWFLYPGGFLGLRYSYSPDYPISISGGYEPTFDTSLDSVYSVHSSVLNDAVEYLITMSNQPNEQAAENRLFQERMRRSPGEYRRPNERKVLR